MGSVLKRKFTIDINNKKYEVYPHLENMIEKTSSQNQQALEEVFDSRSIPIARRVVIQHFLDSVLKNSDFLNQTNR